MRARWAGWIAAVVVGASVLASCGSSPPPNIVLILLDDADKALVEQMPNMQRLLADEGMTFDRAYTAVSLCCPSRASILTGDFVHNHQVLGNRAKDRGGFTTFEERGHERRTVARVLKDAGYSTAMIGKYLNEYGLLQGTALHVAPYWDRWFAQVGDRYLDYDVNVDGEVVSFGGDDSAYTTTVFGEEALDFMGSSDDEPFFAYLAFSAPHSPYVDPPSHAGEFKDALPPSLDKPSFKEKDTSDKPRFYRTTPRNRPFNEKAIVTRYRHRLRMLSAVDDFVAELVEDLESKGELDNTYIVLTSDNGWMQGEHLRETEKAVPYEESVRMPLLVRGPGIEAGSSSDALVSLVDLYATFADLAGSDERRDGRSLVPLLHGESPDWRTQLLVEYPDGINRIPGYEALITDRWKYIEHATDEIELYDLTDDPYEIESQHEAEREVIDDLAPKLDRLRDCKSDACRTADGGPE